MEFATPILTPTQLRKLEKHKYSAECQSLLDPYMQRWWNLVVTWVPMWVAPNLITMVGLVLNVATSVLLIWFCPTATEPAPQWITFSCALGLFLYQTLDAIDGKQARRTGTSTPLGELFDHGCDSISTVFVTLASACTTSLGYSPGFLLIQCLFASALFYCAHWQTYVTGTMRFGKFDVTEGQMCVIGLMLASSIFGPQMWDIKLLNIMDLRLVPTLFASVMGLISLFLTLCLISRGGAGKNGSTIAGTSVITPIIPLLFVLGPAVVLALNSSQNVYEENPVIFLLTFGLMAAKITNKLIVAHMSRSEMSYEDITMVVPTAFLIRHSLNITLISESTILICSFLFIICDLLRYCQVVCLEICKHLKVELFRIKAPSR